jgi:hypothetical protein
VCEALGLSKAGMNPLVLTKIIEPQRRFILGTPETDVSASGPAIQGDSYATCNAASLPGPGGLEAQPQENWAIDSHSIEGVSTGISPELATPVPANRK